MDLPTLLDDALHKLGKQDKAAEYLQYLRGEWYSTVDELRLAIADGAAWSDLQLPGRLKLELKTMILTHDATTSSSSSAAGQSNGLWTKCFSTEHNTHYYINNETNVSQWEIPDEFIEQKSFPSSSTAPVLASSSGAVGTIAVASPHPPVLATRHSPTASSSFPEAPVASVSAILPSCPPLPDDLTYLPRLYSPNEVVNQGVPPEYQRWDEVAHLMDVHHAVRPAVAVRIRDNGDELSSGSETSEALTVDDAAYDENIKVLSEMGFPADLASEALVENSNDLSAAAAYLVTHPRQLVPSLPSPQQSSAGITAVNDGSSSTGQPEAAATTASTHGSSTKKFTVPLPRINPRVNLFGLPQK
jgi:hypothetical protein